MDNETHSPHQPLLSQAQTETTLPVQAVDEYGQKRDGFLSAERPLTIFLDKRELVTLMTMGSQPELLVLGWLRNQNLVTDLSQIHAIQVDWEVEAAVIITHHGVEQIEEKTARKTVTTGCGQGTVYGDLLERLEHIKLPAVQLKQSSIYDLLAALSRHNEIYRQAGAVHGCALCHGTDITLFVEDVGRHNAVDTIAGHMWLHDIKGQDKVFYTTGRLTSEMVIKVAQMQIPVLLSRSGATHMGLELAKKLGVILIARAKGRHFLVYQGAESIEFDALPRQR